MSDSSTPKKNISKNNENEVPSENKKFPIKLKKGQIKEAYLTNEDMDHSFAEIKKSTGQVVKFYKGVGGDNVSNKITELKLKANLGQLL